MPTYKRKTIDLIISDDLRNLLTEIESESIVAKLLLKKRHSKEDLVESPVNYISISHDDNSKISYLTQDRINSLEPDSYWTSNSRYKGKPGAFVGKIFKDIPAREVEKFASLFRSQSMKIVFTFKVVEQDDIKKYYHHENYVIDSDGYTKGSLGSSCMKHQHCQKLFKLYTKNTNQVKMLVMLDQNEKLIGRALLWDLESNKIMDRIYTIFDEDYAFHFKKWATKNGYLYKSEQNWFNTLFFENLKVKKKELYLEFNVGKNPKKYPYMDTFKFVNLESGRLYNYIPESISVKTLTSSDGGYHDGDHLRFDGIHKVFRYRNEVNWLPYLNLYTRSYDCNYSEVNDTYILKKDSEYDNEIGYIFTGEYEHLNNKTKIEEFRNPKPVVVERETVQESIPSYYDYSDFRPQRSLSEVISDLSDVMADINVPDLGSIGSSLYRQWQELSRTEQQEILEQVALEQVVEQNVTDELEEQTPF